jgi:GMP synthase-like glutamine amidotransferase
MIQRTVASPFYDEVLAQNELCPIQALALELPSGSIFFGTQYHPEFTLSVAAG